jgi:hypothetical protein
MYRRTALFLVSMSFSMLAPAAVTGGTNLGALLNYPGHSCRKPVKPVKPDSFNSQWEIETYNQQVGTYNSDVPLYASCIKTYFENAKNDIKRIEEKMDRVAAEVNKAPD